jgi:hypothetical protein
MNTRRKTQDASPNVLWLTSGVRRLASLTYSSKPVGQG